MKYFVTKCINGHFFERLDKLCHFRIRYSIALFIKVHAYLVYNWQQMKFVFIKRCVFVEACFSNFYDKCCFAYDQPIIITYNIGWLQSTLMHDI